MLTKQEQVKNTGEYNMGTHLGSQVHLEILV